MFPFLLKESHMFHLKEFFRRYANERHLDHTLEHIVHVSHFKAFLQAEHTRLSHLLQSHATFSVHQEIPGCIDNINHTIQYIKKLRMKLPAQSIFWLDDLRKIKRQFLASTSVLTNDFGTTEHISSQPHTTQQADVREQLQKYQRIIGDVHEFLQQAP